MIIANLDTLIQIYEKVRSIPTNSITLIVPFVDVDEVKEIKFDIFYHLDDGGYRTNLVYLDKGNVEIDWSQNLETHIKDVEKALNNMGFCRDCDGIIRGNMHIEYFCLKCAFIKSFIQDDKTFICSICQETIQNDFLKVRCCGQFFHKNCRYRMGKWENCPLCRSEEIRY